MMRVTKYVGEDISRIHCVQSSLKRARSVAVRAGDQGMIDLTQAAVMRGSRYVRANLLLSAFMRGKRLNDVEPNRRCDPGSEGELQAAVVLGGQLLNQWLRAESQRIGAVVTADRTEIIQNQKRFYRWAMGRDYY